MRSCTSLLTALLFPLVSGCSVTVLSGGAGSSGSGGSSVGSGNSSPSASKGVVDNSSSFQSGASSSKDHGAGALPFGSAGPAGSGLYASVSADAGRGIWLPMSVTRGLQLQAAVGRTVQATGIDVQMPGLGVQLGAGAGAGAHVGTGTGVQGPGTGVQPVAGAQAGAQLVPATGAQTLVVPAAATGMNALPTLLPGLR